MRRIVDRGAIGALWCAGCIGINQGEAYKDSGSTEGETEAEVEGTDTGDTDVATSTTTPTTTSPTSATSSATIATTSSSTVSQRCDGDLSVLVETLPLAPSALCCPGEVHRYELAADFGPIAVEGQADDCGALDVQFVGAGGSPIIFSGVCDTWITPAGFAGAVLFVRNDSGRESGYDLVIDVSP